MGIRVRPATDFADVATMLGPKRPDANVCWCLSYRIPARENHTLLGTQRGEKVAELMQQGPPGVLAYDGNDVVGWAAVHPRDDTSFANSRKIPHVDDLDVWSVWCIRVRGNDHTNRVTPLSGTQLPGTAARAFPTCFWQVQWSSPDIRVRRRSRATRSTIKGRRST